MKDEAAKVSQVIDLEESSYKEIRSAIEADLQAFVVELKKRPKLLQVKNLFKLYRPKENKELTRLTHRLFMKSLVLGMVHTAAPASDFADVGDLSMKALDDALTFEEAIKWSRGRLTLTSKEFYALSSKVRSKAFTVSKLGQHDLIEKARTLYLKQLEGETSSVEDFIKSIRADVDATGFPGYYETVYRTNIQTDYNAGRAMELEQTPPALLEFIGIEDSRQTDICSVRSGVILPYDDPWWNDNWPPLHFNCRSTVRAIYQEEADLLGIKATGKPGTTKKSSVAEGFGAHPTRSGGHWDPTPAQLARAQEYGVRL